MAAPNREPQEYGRNLPTRNLIFYWIPIIFLGFRAWGLRIGTLAGSRSSLEVGFGV